MTRHAFSQSKTSQAGPQDCIAHYFGTISLAVVEAGYANGLPSRTALKTDHDEPDVDVAAVEKKCRLRAGAHGKRNWTIS